MKLILSSLLFILVFTACDVTKKRDKAVAKKNNAWYLKNYTYADGSANKYVFNRNSFEYFPVTPETSSSGTYSGGDYVKLVPELDKFYQVVDLIQKAYDLKTDHIEKREMGTGLLRVEQAGSVTEFMLKMNSSVRKEIEAILSEMKNTK